MATTVLFFGIVGALGAYGLAGGSLALALAASVLMVLVTVLSPPAGLAAFIVAVPYDALSAGGVGGGPFTLWTPAIAAGVALHVIARATTWRFPRPEALFLLLLFATFALGAVTAGTDFAPNLRYFVSLAQQLVILVLFISVLDAYPAALSWLVTGVFVSAVLAVVVALWTGGDQARLALHGDDVRGLANALGLTAVVGVAVLGASGSQSLQESPLAAVPAAVAAGLVLIAFLALVVTVSRGVIGAVTLAILSFVVFFAARDTAAARRILLLSVVLVGAVIVLAPLLDSFTRGWLSRRIVQTVVEGRGIGIRLELWAAPFAGFDGLRWLVGVGPGHFQTVGTGMYPHSVFVSLTHSGGLLALGAVGGLITWNLADAARRGVGWLVVPFTVYLGANFATHGSVHSKPFWVTLLVLVAVGRLSLTGTGDSEGGRDNDVVRDPDRRPVTEVAT